VTADDTEEKDQERDEDASDPSTFGKFRDKNHEDGKARNKTPQTIDASENNKQEAGENYKDDDAAGVDQTGAAVAEDMRR
jgi:hypothetical protein